MKLETKKNNNENKELKKQFTEFCEGNAGLQSKLDKQIKKYKKLNNALSSAIAKDDFIAESNLELVLMMDEFHKIIEETNKNIGNFNHLIIKKERTTSEDASVLTPAQIIALMKDKGSES